ncbi:TPA: tetratricopeptide repeat protein [Escherichia coli]
MKENNLNRVIGWSGLLLTSLLSTSALADNIGTSAEELGLSDYRHFVIYPRLDKALKAQKNNDEATAIREFEYIHQQVPDNIPLTLYLAEAYRHFGHDDRARLLLEDQLKRHPGDARLERSLAAIPVEVKSVTTVEELLAQQKACDAAPTLRCRSEVGQNALRLAQLPVARAQLNDATFAASPEGKTLRTDLLQRAIYLKQWSQADTLYNEARQQNTLSAAERRQWFDVLLAGQLDDRILALQSQGIFTDPQSYITYATALAAWQKISLHDMSNEDLLAAANTAQAAGNGAARDRWLQQAEQRGLGNNALYWWLHAQRYIPGQPELALNDLTRSINIAPSANAYVARATIYRQRHNVPAAVSDLRAALELEPNNSNTQAALGYALWDSGDIAQSREMLEQAHKGLPDDPALIRQLAYVNQRLDDMPATQHYARLVIDDIDNQALITPLTPEQNQQRFNFRRLHEEVGRRWTFSFDSSIGLRSGAMSTANNNVGGAAPGKSYRSYGQLEAEYRIGRNMLLEGDLLSVYSRVFADTGENGVMMPVKNPMSGTGLRWKPLRDQIFFLAVEQQLPLNGQNGASDTMLRASASFFNGGKYSDEWHPNGSGWFAQNLYLDAAQYIRQDIQAWTADYRVSWHQKVANGQTIEPYAHVQDNGYRDKGTQGAQLGGVGVRWNIWTGETHYDAWPHKVSLGVEYQHTFKAINQRNGERNNAFLTIGVHW